MLPLYEAKMFHQFDHRWATYDGTTVRDVTAKQKQDASFVVLPRYWVAEKRVDERLAGPWNQPWLLAFRDIARATDARTAIASALPRTAVGHKSPLIAGGSPLVLQALFSSFAFDYATRQKLGGTSLTYFIVKQLPAPSAERLKDTCPWDQSITLGTWIGRRVRRLVATSDDIAEALSQPTVTWNDDERSQLRAELDAAFFILFGVPDEEVAYILDSFPIIRRAEEAATGSFATKLRIQHVLSDLRRAIHTGQPYVSPVTTMEPTP